MTNLLASVLFLSPMYANGVFTCNLEATAGTHYIVQSSTDLVTWQDASPELDWTQAQVSISPAQTNLFFRAKIIN